MSQGCCACHLIHACDERFSSTLSPPFSSTSSSSHLSVISCTSLPHFFHFLEGRGEPVHSAEKGMDSLDDSYLPHKLHKQDFGGLLSSRVSRVLGPISRRRIADILPTYEVSRVSRPGLLVGFLLIFCSGLCSTENSHCRERSNVPCWMPR